MTGPVFFNNKRKQRPSTCTEFGPMDSRSLSKAMREKVREYAAHIPREV